MSPKAPFAEHTRRRIQERYCYQCSVCLQSVIKGHCAHLFQKAAIGGEHVVEAIALGILDSHTSYNRSGAHNGTLQCPTCHLEYFTKGLLVWSPPIDVLRWIVDQMSGKRETMEMRQIFSALESNAAADFPEELRHFINHYTLIPIFKPRYRSERYEIHCSLPPLSILVDGEFRQHLPPLEGLEVTYRIFNDVKARGREISAPNYGVVSFPGSGSQDDASPLNYWYLPVNCNVILYLFLLEADKVAVTQDTRSEILLAKKIYDQLREAKGPDPFSAKKYFSKRRLMWSPPIAVLQWIVDQMSGKKETIEMRKIFSALEPNADADFPEELRHFANHYSLIPIFKLEDGNKRYEIQCRDHPPVSVARDGEFRQDLPALKGEATYRIFNYRETHARSIIAPAVSNHSVVSFRRSRFQNDAPHLKYWYLPVNCNLILYRFLLEADKVTVTTNRTPREVLLAREIYSRLREVKELQDRRIAKFGPKPEANSEDEPRRDEGSEGTEDESDETYEDEENSGV
ncbi:hypothetical protein B0H14DRAFT_3875868 [Mycena olivaceomarginata]|nr:hypothetical protein B0H14DRAFT_3875868 [Mycena olivaceomarginata]